MTRTERRQTRLLLVIIVLASALGLLAVPPTADGSALIPLSLVGGIVGLWLLRPGKAKAPRQNRGA